jgi:hypothetical protein
VTRIGDQSSRAIASSCVAFVLASHLLAQTSTTPQSGHVPPPDRVLYFILFDNISKQDSMAIQQTAAGKNGDAVKNYYATTIGLSAPDFQVLHDTALTCRGSVKQQDEAAAVVIKNFRAAAAAANAPLPAVPGELTTMQQQRNAIVMGCAAQLKEAMTAAGYQKLDQFLHQQLVKHVQVKPPAALIRKGQDQSQNTRLPEPGTAEPGSNDAGH